MRLLTPNSKARFSLVSCRLAHNASKIARRLSSAVNPISSSVCFLRLFYKVNSQAFCDLQKIFWLFSKFFLFSPKRKKAPTNKTACYGDLFVGASRFSGLTRRLLPEWTCNGISCDALSTATRNVVIPHEIVLIVVCKSFSRRRICIAPLASPADPPTDGLRSAFRTYDLYISFRIPVSRRFRSAIPAAPDYACPTASHIFTSPLSFRPDYYIISKHMFAISSPSFYER